MTAGPLVKVQAWYDNEWAYANRVADLTALIAEQMDPAPGARWQAAKESAPAGND
jgi:glyceraldehyde 3-phosphate dehydrogenase